MEQYLTEQQVTNLIMIKIKNYKGIFEILELSVPVIVSKIMYNKEITELFYAYKFDAAADAIIETYLQPPEKPAYSFTAELINSFIKKYIKNEDIKSLTQQYYENKYFKPIGAHYANQLTPFRLLYESNKNTQGKNILSISSFDSLEKFYGSTNTGGEIHSEHEEYYNEMNIKFPPLFQQINEVSNQLCLDFKTMNESGGNITSLMIDQYNFICLVIFGEELYNKYNFIKHIE